jgi:hypothetical protein
MKKYICFGGTVQPVGHTLGVLVIGTILIWIEIGVQKTYAQSDEPRLGQSGNTKQNTQVIFTPDEQAYLSHLGPITVSPDQDSTFTGIAADLLDLISRRLGIEFTYVFPQNWNEALRLSRSEEILILPFLNKTPEREE